MEPDQAGIRAFYDDRWAGFQFANRLKCIRAAAILDLFASTRAVEPRILDVGSGAGWMTNILSMFGPATGLEISPVAVAAASARYPHASFFEGDVRTFTSAELFEVVVAQEVLEHFEDHREFMDSVNRLLKPGGWLILTTPNATTLAAMSRQQRSSFQNQPVENPVSMKQLEQLLTPGYRLELMRTVVPGFGASTLAYRLAHSRKLWRVWNGIFGADAAERLTCRLGFGLHLAVLARKVG